SDGEMQYLENAGAGPNNVGLIDVDYGPADHPYFMRSKARASSNMTDSSASGQTFLGLIAAPRDEPETSEGINAITHDENIAYMMQQMANMQSEIDRL
ncbi:hypothetical protein HAX54_051670, partial [Datura stramonium]|nr:hypothetical protein [Datura stramonium]